MATCWIVTEKLVGLQNQAIGLAEALGLPYIIKEIEKPRWPWQKLVYGNHGLVPPWPDILISCGRQSVAISIHIRKASANRTFTVHIQDPHTDCQQFDVVVAPAHDQLHGSNVIITQGAIHRVTQEKLVSAAKHFSPLLAGLPRPLICVLVGGKNRHQDFSKTHACRLADMLLDAAKSTGGGIAITPSRRTGKENEAILKSRLQTIPAYIWDGQGENPYFGLLALADTIVVTSDSISMISEACFTGKPVYVYELPGAGKRHKEFLQDLIKSGRIRTFSGKIETWGYPPLDETQRASDFVRQRLLEKESGNANIRQR